MRLWFKRLILLVLLIAPTIAALVWAGWPSVMAIAGVMTHEPLKLADDDLVDTSRVFATKRSIQKHLLHFGTYVPIEDIVTASPRDVASGDLSLLMQKACGRGKVFVWIPLRIRLPIVGERVYEWCWKPQLQSS